MVAYGLHLPAVLYAGGARRGNEESMRVVQFYENLRDDAEDLTVRAGLLDLLGCGLEASFQVHAVKVRVVVVVLQIVLYRVEYDVAAITVETGDLLRAHFMKRAVARDKSERQTQRCPKTF